MVPTGFFAVLAGVTSTGTGRLPAGQSPPEVLPLPHAGPGGGDAVGAHAGAGGGTAGRGDDVGAVSEVVLDGESGFLVPPGAAEAVAAKLQRLIREPAAWEVMGRRGRVHVEKRHEIERQNDRLVEIYADVLREPSAWCARVAGDFHSPEAIDELERSRDWL